MSNVLKEQKKQQVIALGRLGWSLRLGRNAIESGSSGGATGGVSKPLDEKAVRCCDRCRLKISVLFFTLLFNPALSQPTWFEPSWLSAVPFGSAYLSGRTGLPGTGRSADGYSGLRELVTASGRPLLWSGRPLVGRQVTFRGCALRCSTVI